MPPFLCATGINGDDEIDPLEAGPDMVSPLDSVDPLEAGPSARDLEMVEYEETEAAGLEVEEDYEGDVDKKGYEDYAAVQVEGGGGAEDGPEEGKRGRPRKTPAAPAVRKDVPGGMVAIETLRMMKEKGGAPKTLRRKRTDPLFPKKHPFPFDWGARCDLEPGCRAHLVSDGERALSLVRDGAIAGLDVGFMYSSAVVCWRRVGD